MTRAIRILLLLLVVLAALVAGVLFYVRNQQQVSVDFFVISPTLPLALWMVLALAVGVFLSWAALSFRLFRLRIENVRLSRRYETATREVDNLRENLRALPAKDVA